MPTSRTPKTGSAPVGATPAVPRCWSRGWCYNFVTGEQLLWMGLPGLLTLLCGQVTKLVLPGMVSLWLHEIARTPVRE